jgi:hypothetical protein
MSMETCNDMHNLFTKYMYTIAINCSLSMQETHHCLVNIYTVNPAIKDTCI